MGNIVGTAVWVIKFSDPSMFDENAIFSTREKALAYLDAEFERLKDIWKNRTLIDNKPFWYEWSFDCLYSYEGQVKIHLYRTVIL